MTPADFLKATPTELSKHTSLDASRWSKYFAGAMMNEDIIYRTALELEMNYLVFLESLNERRMQTMRGSVFLRAITARSEALRCPQGAPMPEAWLRPRSAKESHRVDGSL